MTHYKFLCLVCFVTLATCTPAAKQYINTSKPIIFNAKGEMCDFAIVKAGLYRLSGAARRRNRYTNNPCAVSVRSSPNSKIRFTFVTEILHCDQSIVAVYDGLRVFDWHRGTHYILPKEVSRDERTNLEAGSKLTSLCDNYLPSKVIETSQNVGEILFQLAAEDSLIVKVEFVDDNEMCNVYINDIVDGLYKISNYGMAGVCTWYVSGAISVEPAEVRLHNSRLRENETCNGKQNYLQITSSSRSWRLLDAGIIETVCQRNKSSIDYIIPCKYTRIELHTEQAQLAGEQYVTFHMSRLDDMSRVTFAHHCFGNQHATNLS